MLNEVIHRDSDAFTKIFEELNNGINQKLKKWSLARNQNVDYVYSLWQEDPNRVEILEDSKYLDYNLVIMNKKKLEHLLDSHRKLVDLSKKKEKELDLLLQAVDHVASLSKANSIVQDPSLKSAFSLLDKLKENFKH